MSGPPGIIHAAHDCYSYYRLHDCRSGKRLAVVRSIISDETFRVSRQAVFFSPTGRTVLINEDTTDSSPVFCNTLLYYDGTHFSSRDLQLPRRSKPIPYGSWPFVVSITDTDVEYQFSESATTERSKSDDLRDRGF